ncbi:hypothetical protein HDU96_010841 [Phlyctochytrium bullatum]|nr:hypothetical protein HDU96_010841 [Phlyctochytrium bullatum]
MYASPAQQTPFQEQPPIHVPAGIPAIAASVSTPPDSTAQSVPTSSSSRPANVPSTAASEGSNSAKTPNPKTTTQKKAPVASPKKAGKATAQSANPPPAEAGSLVDSGAGTSASTITGTSSAKKRKPTQGEDVVATAASKTKRNRVSADHVATEATTSEGTRGERPILGEDDAGEDEDNDMGEDEDGDHDSDGDDDGDGNDEVSGGYVFDGIFISEKLSVAEVKELFKRLANERSERLQGWLEKLTTDRNQTDPNIREYLKQIATFYDGHAVFEPIWKMLLECQYTAELQGRLALRAEKVSKWMGSKQNTRKAYLRHAVRFLVFIQTDEMKRKSLLEGLDHWSDLQMWHLPQYFEHAMNAPVLNQYGRPIKGKDGKDRIGMGPSCAKQVFAAVGELERLMSVVLGRAPLLTEGSEYGETFRSILRTCRTNVKDGSPARYLVLKPPAPPLGRKVSATGVGATNASGADFAPCSRAAAAAMVERVRGACVTRAHAAAMVKRVSVARETWAHTAAMVKRVRVARETWAHTAAMVGPLSNLGQALLLRSDQLKLIELGEFSVFMTEGNAHYDRARIYELGVILKEFKTNRDAKKLMTYWGKRHSDFPIDFETDSGFIKTMRIKLFAGKEFGDDDKQQDATSSRPQGTAVTGKKKGTASTHKENGSVATKTMGETVKSAFKAAGLTLPVYGKNVTHYWFRKIGLTQAMRFGASQEDVEYVGWKSHAEAMKTYYGDGTPEAAGFYKYEAYIIPRQEAEVPEELRKRIFPFLSDTLAAKDLASLYNQKVLDDDHFVWNIDPLNTAQFKEFA